MSPSLAGAPTIGRTTSTDAAWLQAAAISPTSTDAGRLNDEVAANEIEGACAALGTLRGRVSGKVSNNMLLQRCNVIRRQQRSIFVRFKSRFENLDAVEHLVDDHHRQRHVFGGGLENRKRGIHRAALRAGN